MSQFSSIIEVLAVENEERVSKRTQNKYTHFAARCVLRNDKNEVVTVGTLRSDQILPELRDQVKVGLFAATFSLRVADWGESKGDIVSVLTGFMPAQARVPQAAAAK
ncbi:hypothetical protein CKY39_27310 [Variovorax boronicumulans]|uniref:Single-stranded DNA-binding protein n=1 Tax=Variovorax boronicumulans TaxID=436515 RepID=A0A250DQ86_9BURK|nr:hypothetical protein [Variovorax boronicumulans]ATA56530.1 hypothetical protein CKY39_27310 [Variovorax boronicumulans]